MNTSDYESICSEQSNRKCNEIRFQFLNCLFTVSRLAQEKIAPLVRKMDEDNQLDPSVIQTLFENGLMGIEIPTDYGGSECKFMTTMLVVEELSKVYFLSFFF